MFDVSLQNDVSQAPHVGLKAENGYFNLGNIPGFSCIYLDKSSLYTSELLRDYDPLTITQEENPGKWI